MSSRIPCTPSCNAHHRPSARVVLNEFNYADRDVLGLEDSTRLAQLLQAIQPKSSAISSDLVDANPCFLCKYASDPETLTTPAFTAA